MPYLIAYDISDPRRLRRVARFLERHAFRCQKSVFLARGKTDRIHWVLQELTPLLEPSVDCVQAWELAAGQSLQGLVLGKASFLTPCSVVADTSSLYVIEVRQHALP